MGDDIYCDQVLRDKIQIKKIDETENILAFHHTNPSWPVHIIVITKKHVPSLLELIDDEKMLVEMMGVIKKVIEKVLHERGECRLTTNFGKCQTSKHLHWHIYVGKMSE